MCLAFGSTSQTGCLAVTQIIRCHKCQHLNFLVVSCENQKLNLALQYETFVSYIFLLVLPVCCSFLVNSNPSFKITSPDGFLSLSSSLTHAHTHTQTRTLCKGLINVVFQRWMWGFKILIFNRKRSYSSHSVSMRLCVCMHMYVCVCDTHSHTQTHGGYYLIFEAQT